MKELSEYVRNIRKSLHLSQRKFGLLIGKTTDCIKNYENDRSDIPGSVLIRIQAIENAMIKSQTAAGQPDISEIIRQ